MISSLEELCQDTLAKIIVSRAVYEKSCQNGDTDSPSTSKINPFGFLTSKTVDKLLNKVLEFAKFNNYYITFSMVQVLMDSDKVTEFQLRNAIMDVSEFLKLSEALAKHGEHLICLVLEIKLEGDCSCSIKKHTLEKSTEEDCSVCSNAIEQIIEAAPNIRCFVSFIKFDIMQLARLKHLKELKLGFLSDWETYAYSNMRIKKAENMLFILQTCPELTVFENDIATAMQWLDRERDKEDPAPTFQLESIFLGPESYHEGLFEMVTSANPTAVRLASEMCPKVTKLKMYLTDERPIEILFDCWKSSLELLEVGCMRDKDFVTLNASYLITEMENMGENLKTLRLLNFQKVDLVEIARLCPNLRELALIDCCTTLHSMDALPKYDCFNKLEKVLIDPINRAPPKEPNTDESAAFLFMVAYICRCPKLKQFFIYNMPLEAQMIRDLAKLKCFSRLTSLYLVRGHYQVNDLTGLLSTCQNLEELEIGEFETFDNSGGGSCGGSTLVNQIKQVKPNLRITITNLKELSRRMTTPYQQ